MKRTHKTTKIQPANYRIKISHVDKYIRYTWKKHSKNHLLSNWIKMRLKNILSADVIL